MNRNDFQSLSRIRIREAKILLDARQYPGAYYLAGYAVECALKACFTKKIKKYDFPDKKLINSVHTHKLIDIIKGAELYKKFNDELNENNMFQTYWKTVEKWNEEVRYNTNITQAEARDFYKACTARKNGVLTWIKKRW